MMMLEDMANKKRMNMDSDAEAYEKVSPKPKIRLSDNEFGKY